MSAAPPLAPAPWTQTASGRALDLGAPLPPDALDIRHDIAAPLGLICRYSGQLPACTLYSVAQHCCIGADWALSKTRDHRLALAFLLHDAHEALIGDWTTPAMAALDREMQAISLEAGVDLRGVVTLRAARKRLTHPIDAWMHAQAGLDWPLSEEARGYIAMLDLRMLVTERRDLLAQPPRPWGAQIEAMRPLDTPRIKPLSPAKASEAWITRYEAWSARVRADAAGLI